MRGVVRKTGSGVRILPQELPRDVRGEMEGMQMLEAAGEDEDKDVKVTEESVIKRDDNEAVNDKDEDTRKSGKIKRRGKRRANGETVVEGENEEESHKIGVSNEVPEKQVEKVNMKEIDAKDRKDVNKFINDQKSVKSKSKVLTFEEISVIANKLEQGKEVTMPKEEERALDMQMMEKVGQAVGRISSRRREEYLARLAAAKQKVEGN